MTYTYSHPSPNDYEKKYWIKLRPMKIKLNGYGEKDAYRQMQEFQQKIAHLEWKEHHYMELIENGMKDDCNPLEH